MYVGVLFFQKGEITLKTTLIICAMEKELAVLLVKLNLKKLNHKPWSVYKHPEKPLYATVSGVGKVNAAGSLANAIEIIKPDHIIGFGVAGGVSPKVQIGDIVICDKFIQHDMDVTAIGYKLGQVPGFTSEYMYSDSALIKAAQTIAEENELYHTHTGAIMSGDCFVKDNKGARLYELFGAMCVDMESAAWAQIASLFNLPILVIRSISDQADGNAPENYQEFLEKAIINLSALIEKLIDMKVN